MYYLSNSIKDAEFFGIDVDGYFEDVLVDHVELSIDQIINYLTNYDIPNPVIAVNYPIAVLMGLCKLPRVIYE